MFDKYKFRLQSNLKIFENHIVVRNKNDIRVSKRMFVRFYKMIQQYQIKIKREKNFFLKSQLIQIIHELHDLRFVVEQIVNVLRYNARLFVFDFFDNEINFLNENDMSIEFENEINNENDVDDENIVDFVKNAKKI